MKRKYLAIIILQAVVLCAACGSTKNAPKGNVDNAKKEAIMQESTNSKMTDSDGSEGEIVEETNGTVYMKTVDGKDKYSIDLGKTWIDKEEYEVYYPPKETSITWWSSEDYQKYLDVETESMDLLIKNKCEGYSDEDGQFVWTEDIKKKRLTKLNEELDQIKSGTKISREIISDCVLDQDMVVEQEEGHPDLPKAMTFTVEAPNIDSKTFEAETALELKKKVVEYCDDLVKEGKLTSEDEKIILDNVNKEIREN